MADIGSLISKGASLLKGAGRAGWDTYFNERLRDDNYRWLPRAYFNGASAANGVASTTLFYQQPGNAAAKAAKMDESTAAEHEARYGR